METTKQTGIVIKRWRWGVWMLLNPGGKEVGQIYKLASKRFEILWWGSFAQSAAKGGDKGGEYRTYKEAAAVALRGRP